MKNEDMIKIISTEEADKNRKKLADRIVKMINNDYSFNLKTVESSQLSESIFELLKQEGVPCQ
jgi:hypothetical protein